MRLPNLPFNFSLTESERRLWTRLFALLLFSVVLHWVVLQWIVDVWTRPMQVSADHAPINLRLNVGAAASDQGSNAASQQAQKSNQALTKTAEKSVPATHKLSLKSDVIASQKPTPSSTSERASIVASSANDSGVTMGEQGYLVKPPPSATLRIHIVRTAPNQADVEGDMEFVWRVAERRYTLMLNAKLNAPNGSSPLYVFQSTGVLDAYGLAPSSASIARRGRAETAMHFDRQSQRVSFSASNNSTALQAGTQDRASLFVQLAGIATADPTQIAVGKLFALDVAEERGVSRFEFVVVERARLLTSLGEIDAWHLRRVLPTNSVLARLEVWLAPDYHWLPVQIQTNEMNGIVTRHTVTQTEF
jgi:hypothetical protein